MPGLWWNWKQFELSAAADDIGQMLQGIGAELRRAGYTGVAVAEDVHGFKENFMVAVLYLEISDRNFWQVIAVIDGPESVIQQVQEQVIDKVSFF
jgi:hypothetical protein